MPSIQPRDLPADALLRKYREGGAYTDCYAVDVGRVVSHAAYVEAFYTSGVFKIERRLLAWFLSRPATDQQARSLATGQIDAFAAWTVEGRDTRQLLLCDFQKRTRSWLMSTPIEVNGLPGTRLYFGSAVVPVVDRHTGQATMGFLFRTLLGFHKLYSRLLLRAALSRLSHMPKPQPSTGKSLLRTLVANELADVVFDVTDVTLDSVMNEGLLRDLPIVGSFANLARAGQRIQTEVLLRQLVRFLSELQKVSYEQRIKLLEKYPDDSNEQNDLGENLLLALERLDAVQKPALLARFFKAYVEETIDYPTFTRLTQALDRFNLALEPHLRWYYTRAGEPVPVPEEVLHELSLSGLVTVSLEGSGSVAGAAGYRYSSIGTLFLEIGFGVHPQA